MVLEFYLWNILSALSVPGMCHQQVRWLHSHLCKINHVSPKVVLEEINFFQLKTCPYFFALIGKTVILSNIKESGLSAFSCVWERGEMRQNQEYLLSHWKSFGTNG